MTLTHRFERVSTVQTDLRDIVSILSCKTPDAVANALLLALGAGTSSSCVVYACDWPRNLQLATLNPDNRYHLPQVEADLVALRSGKHVSGAVVLCDDEQGAVALLIDPPTTANETLLDAARQRLGELLTSQRLSSSVTQLAEAEKLQHALFAIADVAGSNLDMGTMLRELHDIVGKLIYAENFYIVMYHRERAALQFLYFIDTVDLDWPPLDDEIPMARMERGVTWYLVTDGRPLMGTRDQLETQTSGPLNRHGAFSLDWLGVPMLRNGEAFGAVVVQSYDQPNRYGEREREVLSYVAEHILTALERKRSQEEMETRVDERTRQLAAANADLKKQITERLRAEHLQAMLYRIAALANVDESSQTFYRELHRAVGELINAENFYVALLSDDGNHLEFPYFSDTMETDMPRRALGGGLTEYVLRSGRPLLLDESEALRMEARGELSWSASAGAPAVSWLGVPLLAPSGVMGVVAVQSYRTDLHYEPADSELLTFVSYQIANSLQRLNSAEALRSLNADLEARVHDRTRELRDQIMVRERIEEQLRHQVMHDSLTGLPNRLYIQGCLERSVAQLKRKPERRFALLYLDIDHFKLFNDTLGHLAGDAILKEVSNRLRECVREPDVVARLSGDEFAVLLVDVATSQEACGVAQRVQDTIQRPMVVAGRELNASASIGIAIGDTRYSTVDAILHDADTALYRAKAAGRKRFALFDDTP